MLADILNESVNYIRKNVQYILVYNEAENNREIIGSLIAKKAKKNFLVSGLNKFRNFCFAEVYSYTKKDFEEYFVKPQENKKLI